MPGIHSLPQKLVTERSIMPEGANLPCATKVLYLRNKVFLLRLNFQAKCENLCQRKSHPVNWLQQKQKLKLLAFAFERIHGVTFILLLHHNPFHHYTFSRFNAQQINPRLQAADVNGGFFTGQFEGFHRAAVGGDEGCTQP